MAGTDVCKGGKLLTSSTAVPPPGVAPIASPTSTSEGIASLVQTSGPHVETALPTPVVAAEAAETRGAASSTARTTEDKDAAVAATEALSAPLAVPAAAVSPSAATVAADTDVDVLVAASNGNGNGNGAKEKDAREPSRTTLAIPPHPFDFVHARTVSTAGGAASVDASTSSAAASSSAGGALWSPLHAEVRYPELSRVAESYLPARDGKPAVHVRLWHKQDTTFRLPKTYFHAQVDPTRVAGGTTSEAHGASPSVVFAEPRTARESVLARLAVSVFNDLVNERLYDSSTAGLGYDVSRDSDTGGVTIGVSGFSHKLPVLLRHVSEALKSYAEGKSPSDDEATAHTDFISTYRRRVDALQRAYKNASKAQAHQIASEVFLQLVHRRQFSPDECLEAMQGALDLDEAGNPAAIDATAGSADRDARITPQAVRECAASLLEPSTVEGGEQRLLVEGVAYGNVTPADAHSMGRELVASLTSPSSAASSAEILPAVSSPPSWPLRPVNAALLLPARTTHVVTRPHPNPLEPNCCVDVSWQLGAKTPRNYAIARLLQVLINQPAFDALRTKEQIGYIVSTGCSTSCNAIVTLSVTVQSSVASVQYIQDRIDAFIESFRATKLGPAELNADTLRVKQDVLAHQLLEPDKTPSAEFSRLLSPVFNAQHLDFHRAEAIAAAVRAVTVDDVLEAFDACIAPAGSRLRKIVVRVHAQAGSASAAATTAPLRGGGPAAVDAHPEELKMPFPAVKAAALGGDGLSANDIQRFWLGLSSTDPRLAAASGLWVSQLDVI